jgi:hypothetical protein
MTAGRRSVDLGRYPYAFDGRRDPPGPEPNQGPIHCKKVIVFPSPAGRSLTNITPPGRELLYYFQPGRVWLLTSRLGTGKTITFFTVYGRAVGRRANRAGICSRVKGWKIDSWNRLGIEGPMSHVHVKINFSYGIDSWNRCLSVHKRLQIRAQLSYAMPHCNRYIVFRFLAFSCKYTFNCLHLLCYTI